MAHSVHATQMMLHICDQFSDDFDIKFNCAKSVAVRVGNRYSEPCAPLQLAGKDIIYVSELKYLGVQVLAVRYWKVSVEYLRLKFYRTCIYAKSKAANSEMVTRGGFKEKGLVGH